jgi:hypothetical protein
MKINTKKNKYKKSLVILGALILLGAAGAGAYYFMRTSQDAKHRQDSSASIDANKNGSEGKESIQGDTNTGQNTNDDKTITPSPPENGTSTSNLEKPTVTRANQSSTNIRVSAIFNQPAFGTCDVVFSKEGSSTIIKSAPIVLGPSYYTCNGFLVPVSEFPTKGSWNVKVIHKQDSSSVESDIQSFTIE